MKILVTGGAGFIGSHIVDRYLQLGHSVVVLDNVSTGQKRFVHPQAVFYQTDIRNQAEVTKIFEKECPQILNHHAAQMDVRKSVNDPKFDADTNILGLLNLLEAGRKIDLKRVIFASSGGAIYGDALELPTTETYRPQPASPYGVSKLSGEYYLHFYMQTYGITYAALRYGNVYGPRQNPHGEAGVIAIFTKKMLAGKQPIINGGGEQSRDFVYVADVVTANELALTTQQSMITNIGTGLATTINAIFNELNTLTNSSFNSVHSEAKAGEQKNSLLNCALAKSQLKWEPKTQLTIGLKQTVDYFRHEK